MTDSIARLCRAGVSVWLEDQGVATFDASWDHLGQRLATALGMQKE